MPRALVTGASGFIGPHLVERLQQAGYQVRCLVRRTSVLERLQPLEPEFVYGDVNDRDSLVAAVADMDVVFHLAGVTKALHYEEFHKVNAEGTGMLAEVCAGCEKPPTLVVVSSLAAAGPSPEDAPRRESDPATPVSNYGRSKLAGELAAAKWANRVPLTIVRPGIVFGDGDALTLEMFRPIERWNLHVSPTLADYRYSLIHAEELVSLLIAAAERGQRVETDTNGALETTGRYLAADDLQPTYVDLGRMIGKALGKGRIFVIRVPKPISLVVISALEVIARFRKQPSIVNLDKIREGSAGDWTCSGEAAKEQLGFHPQFTLDERLRQTADWYRAAGWL